MAELMLAMLGAAFAGFVGGFILGQRDSFKQWESEFDMRKFWFNKYIALNEQVLLASQPKPKTRR
jgi:hypothetical protein